MFESTKFGVIQITHIVNPHQFYFKYLHECIANEKFTSLDSQIQNYGNELYSNLSFPYGYTPVEDELVILFHLIFNKWVRAKVISIGEKIILWCIDNGTFEQSTIQHILPLNQKFQENLNLVHLGGLSLIPAEKTLNIHTGLIEMQPINMWNLKLISIFKMILNNAKVVKFAEEFCKSGHTFGLLKVESGNGTTFNLNDKFMEMNKSMRTDRLTEDISIYVSTFRLQDELYKSVDGAASSSAGNNSHSSSSSTMESTTTENDNSTVTASNSLSHSEVNVSNWMDQSVDTDVESTDFEDSASIIVSSNALPQSKTNGQNEFSYMVNQNGETEIQQGAIPHNNIDLDYKCHLRTYSIIRGNCIVRLPLPSTMDWINSHVTSNRRIISVDYVAREDVQSISPSSAASSIIHHDDNVNSTQSICSTSSNESETIRNKKILALVAATKKNTVEKSTGLNGILQNFSSKVDSKIVNKPTSRINAIPAGYQLNALHTFGDGSYK